MNYNNIVTSNEASYTKAMDNISFMTDNNLSKKISVLIIDDNTVNRLVIKNLFHLLGAEIQEAPNSKVAMELILNHPYHLILMDYLMPDMDGLELTRWIRTLPGEKGRVPVVGVSANLDEEIIKNFLDAGAFTVLSKPIEIEALRNVLMLLFTGHSKFENTFSDAILLKEEDGYDAKIRKELVKKEILKISEIDYNQGLHYALGDAITYMKIIKVSVISICECMDKIYLLINKGKIIEIKREFHSIKSVLMHIGAVKLAKKLIEIEGMRRLDMGRISVIYFVLNELEKLIVALEHAIESYNIVDKNDIYREKLFVDHSQEESILRKGNYIKDAELYASRFYYEKMMDSLRGWLLYADHKEEELVKSAIEAAERFDYDQVLRIIREKRDI